MGTMRYRFPTVRTPELFLSLRKQQPWSLTTIIYIWLIYSLIISFLFFVALEFFFYRFSLLSTLAVF